MEDTPLIRTRRERERERVIRETCKRERMNERSSYLPRVFLPYPPMPPAPSPFPSLSPLTNPPVSDAAIPQLLLLVATPAKVLAHVAKVSLTARALHPLNSGHFHARTLFIQRNERRRDDKLIQNKLVNLVKRLQSLPVS